MNDAKDIWKGTVDLAEINALAHGTMIAHIGIKYTEVGPDYLRGTMPVDGRTTQPFGILHGGASVTLAETLGSMAANLCVDREKSVCVGLDISANYVRKAADGVVTGTARPLHLGGQTHVWEIRIENADGRLVSVCRLTMMVLDR